MRKRLVGQWRGFNPTDSDEYIRAAFTARYGYPPERIEPTGGGILAGPIEGQTELRAGGWKRARIEEKQ